MTDLTINERTSRSTSRRHAAALGAARRSAPDRNQIRLRYCPMRRLHSHGRRHAGALLRDPGGGRSKAPTCHHRGA